MIPGIVYSWSRTIPLDELEIYQFFAILSICISIEFHTHENIHQNITMFELCLFNS